MKTKITNKTSISTVGLLGTAFIVLKLCNIIDWSWWWVLCPFWIGIAIFLLVLIGWFILVCIAIAASEEISRH